MGIRVTIILYVGILLTTIISCTQKETPLEQALFLAGENRPELEKVLNQYKAKSADSLKYRAACFLIENMPGHYSYKEDRIQAFYQDIDSILDSELSATKKRDLIEAIAKQRPQLAEEIVEDARCIKAEYLIRNIDQAFEAWQSVVWAESLDFELFCEYLLPYKALELQVLDAWRDSLHGVYSQKYHSLPYSDQYKPYAIDGAKWINQSLIDALNPYNLFFDKKGYSGYPFLSANTIDRLPFGYCRDYAGVAVAVFRSEGIPAVHDYNLQWGRRHGRHDWCSVLNNDGRSYPFNGGVYAFSAEAFYVFDLMPKVYRTTYAINRRIEKYRRETKRPHPVFSHFMTDVTSEYMKTSNVAIPLIPGKYPDKYAHLCVWGNHRKWAPVDFGEIDGNKISFHNLGRNIAYIVASFDGRSHTAISHPFILKGNGEVHLLNPDMEAVREARLWRKFPKSWNVANLETRVLGAKIQVATNERFTDPITVATIDSLNYPDLIPINIEKRYRYWRYLAPDDSWGSVAEIQFFEKDSLPEKKGRIIGSEAANEQSKENAFDGNWLTNYDAKEKNGVWLGLDFGKPVAISQVRVVPRTDDNGIHCGDEYELMYCGDGQWVSLGKQKATGKYLDYSSVPDNALFLLKNNTRGSEERIFTYEKGKSVWW